MIEYLEDTPVLATIGDTNGDGKPEFLVGTNRGIIYRISDKVETIDEMRFKPKALTAADVNKDNIDEVVVASNFGIYFLGREKVTLGGKNFEFLLPADVNGDGVVEVIGCTRSDIYAFTHVEKIWKNKTSGAPSFLNSVKFGGNEYIALGTYKKIIHIYSFAGKEVAKLKYPAVPNMLAYGDVNGDRFYELVVGGYDDTIRVIGQRGTMKSFPAAHLTTLCVGDVNGDNKSEIIWGSKDNAVHVVGENDQIWVVYSGGWITTIATGDVDNDGNNEIVFGSRDGSVRVVKNGEEIKRIVLGDAIHNLLLCDIDGDNRPEIFAATYNGKVAVEKI